MTSAQRRHAGLLRGSGYPGWTHLLHIFAKLGVDDRTAAVTAAVERGMLRLAK